MQKKSLRVHSIILYPQENPSPSQCLGVFGLSSFTDEKDLKSVFGQYGSIDNIYIIYDREVMRLTLNFLSELFFCYELKDITSSSVCTYC